MLTSGDIKGELLSKIKDHSATIGVVGLGYVGVPFAVEKAKVGYQVIGIDRNEKHVAKINAGENYITDVNDAELKDLVQRGKLRAAANFSCVKDLDVIVIAVPTPLTRNLTPDLQYIESVTREISKRLRPGQLISLESTTYPGTTEELMLLILNESGFELGKDFFLAHSPERVDPGNKRYTTKNTSKVVGGVGAHSHEIAVSFYSQTIEKVIPVSSAKAAELVKVFENTFRAVNIALVNELTLLCDKMELNVWEVLDAAFTKPFGIMPFYPGPGVGGHCIPLDPHYLEWKAKEFNFDTHFIALAGEVNRKMPSFVREKTHRLLNRLGVSPSRSKILILGLSYKKDLGDYRESPALEILTLLKRDGAQLSYYDPYVPFFREHDMVMEGAPALTPELLQGQDLVLIVTDHSTFDYDMIVRNARAVLDTRNATKKVSRRENVTLL